MKVVKPAKLSVLTRVIERARKPELHVAVMLGFPLDTPRAIVDEIAFWAGVSAALGTSGVIDEGITKARPELLVAGSFFAPGGAPISASYVRARVGSVDKRLAVLGDRVWRHEVPTEPEPMTRMPIDWAHAYGGKSFGRNPYGKGAEAIGEGKDKIHPLPNIERFGALIRSPGERPEPAGLLPMDITFAQRREKSGTYDQRWLDEYYPGLPPDAAPTFFNVAPEDQWSEEPFRGDEEFVIENMHPERPRIEGRLPGLVARSFVNQYTPKGILFVEIPLACDTVWLFPANGLGVVVFHGSLPVSEDDGADIAELGCACEEPSSSRPLLHYRAALARRNDRDRSVLDNLSDSDLMPPRESGVAANIGELDIGRWVKSEGIMARNMRRGQEKRFAEARAELEAHGHDASALHLPPEPEPVPTHDMDALVAYMRDAEARAATLMKGLETKAAQTSDRLREAYEEMDVDLAETKALAAKKRAGPPAFSGEEQLALMRRAAADGRSRGRPLEDVEQSLADPAFHERLAEQDASLRSMYQRFGHYQPAASAMDPEASDRVRVLVDLAVETGSSLARRDFTGAKLRGADLSCVDLSGTYLESADLSGCDLSGANLEGAVLVRADLRGANLRGAKLRGANLGGAKLQDAALDGVDLTEGVLSRAELAGASFTDANLKGVDWLDVKPGAVDLSGARLGDCNVLKADFRGARFVGADLSEATFIDCQLDGADFSRAKLEKASFVQCRGEGASFRDACLRRAHILHESALPGADFRDADLEQATLRRTRLTGARFDRANLASADISECDATGASFERTVLKGGMLIRTRLVEASLRGANLIDAIASKALLAGADFTGANLYRADLSRVIGDARTTFAEAEVGLVRVVPKAEVPKGGSA